jgi:putative redox protein
MTHPKPPVTAELIWSEELLLDVSSGKIAFVIDGNSTAGPSPVQLLVVGLAGCMAMDVVDILRRGRHPLIGFRATVTAHRMSEMPRRLTAVDLKFALRGAIPEMAVERAIGLSRDKYCSVWHSMRQDIELTTSFSTEP